MGKKRQGPYPQGGVGLHEAKPWVPYMTATMVERYRQPYRKQERPGGKHHTYGGRISMPEQELGGRGQSAEYGKHKSFQGLAPIHCFRVHLLGKT